MWTAYDLYRLGMWQQDTVLPWRYIKNCAALQAACADYRYYSAWF